MIQHLCSRPAGLPLLHLLRHFGAERLVWGSDWPNTQHREVADFGSTQHALAQWIPDAVARARILVDTSARLFRFL